MAEVPHFAVPFRFEQDGMGHSHAAVNEQDSVEDVTDCVIAIVSCPLGYRLELPNFGIRDQTFSQGGIDTNDLQIAIAQWEPRADILIEEDESNLDRFISLARVVTGKINTPQQDDVQEVGS